MNVFGAFTFGSLIKTFIPGFVWLVALWLLWRGTALLLPVIPQLPVLSDSQLQNALVAAIPVAILLGLLSNIVVFMGVNDALVRQPVRRHAPDLFALQDWVIGRVRDEYRVKLALPDALTRAFASHADAELLILQTIGVAHLA
jgi:hypothetical protein